MAGGAFKVFGTPVAQGSMECLGQRGRIRHLILDSKRVELQPWRGKITAGAKALLDRVGPMAGPLSVSVTFTVPRPPSVPLKKRAYPITRSSGDTDKLLRAVLDALTDAELIKDDSQVIQSEAWKAYPDSPGIPDRMDRPGALIRIEMIT